VSPFGVGGDGEQIYIVSVEKEAADWEGEPQENRWSLGRTVPYSYPVFALLRQDLAWLSRTVSG